MLVRIAQLIAYHSSSNACIMALPKLTFILLCAPLLSPFTTLVMICSTHVMASVLDLGKSDARAITLSGQMKRKKIK